LQFFTECTGEKIDNRSIFGEDMDKSLRYFLAHPADVSTDCPQGILFSTVD